MENQNENFKKIIIIIILIVSISFFIYFKFQNNEEEFYYNEVLMEENSTVLEENIEKEKIKVYITGEINLPGVKELELGARLEDLINVAGGLTKEADIKKVNLAYQLEDGQKIYIPNINDETDEIITTENGEGIIENLEESSEVVNINKADIEDLLKLPGVGESLAQRIINYREENGKFKNIEDLKNVSGIGEKKFESLKEYIVVK